MKKGSHMELYNYFQKAVLFVLHEEAEKNPDSLRAFFISVLEKVPKYDAEKIGWLLNDKIPFNLFHELLTSHKYLTCDIDLFRNHFIYGTNTPKNKIIWRANLNELVYLFSRMREEKIIPLVRTPHIILQKHFLDKYEKPLNPASLRVLLEKSVRNDQKIEIIDSIIKDILWQNKNSQNLPS
jgi:hypothetical protein